MNAELVSYGRRVAELAHEHPDKHAIIFLPQEGTVRKVTWRELNERSIQIARLLIDCGVQRGSSVIVGLPNCPEHFMVLYAIWKAGGLAIPVRFDLPAPERDQIIELAKPAVAIADWSPEVTHVKQLTTADLSGTLDRSTDALPDVIPHPGKAICSGGSTGRPKIIVDPRPWAKIPGESSMALRNGLSPGQVQLVAGPLYHQSPLVWSHEGLFEDHTLILLERFDAKKAACAIETYRVNWAFLAPIMMRRIILLDDLAEYDLSSLQAIFHTAAPCPPWVKRAWIDIVGAENLYEGFGSAENFGAASIRGDEWLEHPDSVGRPRQCDVKILDESGTEVPNGVVGDIYFRPVKGSLEDYYYYVGSPPVRTTEDGFATVGDMGWVDDDGYLHIADRRVDMIITGGANVYPAEIETVLTEHREVSDVAVIGVPDEEWGRRVHAVVQPRSYSDPPSVGELNEFCRERLSAYKAPKSYEFVQQLPRDATGKLRRRSLVDERSNGSWPSMQWVKERQDER